MPSSDASPAALRASLFSVLTKADPTLFDRARRVLRDFAAASASSPSASLPVDVFDALRHAGLLDEMLRVARDSGLNLDVASLELLSGGGGGGASPTGGTPPSPRGGSRHSSAVAPPPAAPAPASPLHTLDPNRRYLRITLGRGRAFLTHIEAAEEDDDGEGVGWEGGGAYGDAAAAIDAAGTGAGVGAGAGGEDDGAWHRQRRRATDAPPLPPSRVRRYYVTHLLVNGQRFRSVPVPAIVEPAFDGSGGRSGDGSGASFLVDVQPHTGGGDDDDAIAAQDAHDRGTPTRALAPLMDLCCGGISASSSAHPSPNAAAGQHAEVFSTIHVIVTLITHRPASTAARALGVGAAAATSVATDRNEEGAGEAAASDGAAWDDVRSEVVGTASIDWRGVCAEESGSLTTLLPLLPTSASAGGILSTPILSSGGVTGGGGDAYSDTCAATPGNLGGGGGSLVPMGLLPLTLSLEPAYDSHAASTGSVSLAESVAPLPREVVASYATACGARGVSASRAFLSYARAWWADYTSLHPSFRHRLVCIFGNGEEAGGRLIPLVSRVTPLVADRILNTPSAAARFVSLIPHRSPREAFGSVGSAIGGGGGGGVTSRSSGAGCSWRSALSVLATKCGSGGDHAALLCSLLLGFGLDAYVVVGTRYVADDVVPGVGGMGRVEEEHAWVLTRYPRPVAASSFPGGFRVVFWEPTTGQRSHAPSEANGTWPRVALATMAAAQAAAGTPTTPSATSTAAAPATCDAPPFSPPYARIACVFSHNRFYGVTSGDDSCSYINEHVGWHFEGALQAGWRGMDARLLSALPHAPAPPLAPPSLSPVALARSLESALKSAITAHRASAATSSKLARARGALALIARNSDLDPPLTNGHFLPAHATPWDTGSLSFLLGQALHTYEEARVQGLPTAHVPDSEGGAGVTDANALPSPSSSADDFAVAIKRAIPAGFAFRGSPLSFNHASPARMWCALLAAHAAREVLETPAHAAPGDTAFALRVEAWVLPEDTIAVWVMFAVRARVPAAHQ